MESTHGNNPRSTFRLSGKSLFPASRPFLLLLRIGGDAGKSIRNIVRDAGVLKYGQLVKASTVRGRYPILVLGKFTQSTGQLQKSSALTRMFDEEFGREVRNRGPDDKFWQGVLTRSDKSAIMLSQVLDLVMNEEKPVVRFSEEELEEDPLLFLGCGHAFPISSLDGHTELGQSYGRSPEGAWEKPLPLEVQPS